MFRLDGDCDSYLHHRPAARLLIGTGRSALDGDHALCLATGERAATVRLHPTIKGWKAQSTGAALVSFNLDAFESYGQVQGENAPTSEVAAFQYGNRAESPVDRRWPQPSSLWSVPVPWPGGLLWQIRERTNARFESAESLEDLRASAGGLNPLRVRPA
jgi:hypothetical protein